MENDNLNVIPSQEMIDAANQSNGDVIEYMPENEGEANAMMEMRELTETQIRNKKHKDYLEGKLKSDGKLDDREMAMLIELRELTVVKRPELAENQNGNIHGSVIQQPKPEKPRQVVDQSRFPESNNRYGDFTQTQYTHPTPNPVQPNIPTPQGYKPIQKEIVNQPFDLVPLPSDGKIYKHKRKTIKMAYLNAADENILTSPNLIQSGEFIDVLMERKILDADIQLGDLHPGDRNALLIWLRATGLGSHYPIVLENPDNPEAKPIEVDFDLSMLNTKPLGDEPDENGLFDYSFPNGSHIKFKFLTIDELERIETFIDYETEVLKMETPNSIQHRLREQIVTVNGITGTDAIDDLINSIRLRDKREFIKHIDSIESGVDMQIEVSVPGREQPIRTTFPFTPEFFWG